jgi:hypothetical protein
MLAADKLTLDITVPFRQQIRPSFKLMKAMIPGLAIMGTEGHTPSHIKNVEGARSPLLYWERLKFHDFLTRTPTARRSESIPIISARNEPSCTRHPARSKSPEPEL